MSIVDALVGIGFANSRGEAKRLIAGGGARLDGEAISDEGYLVTVAGEAVRLSAGKKKHGVLRAG
jgi:tyrosyl-tRNA synthetase